MTLRAPAVAAAAVILAVVAGCGRGEDTPPDTAEPPAVPGPAALAGCGNLDSPPPAASGRSPLADGGAADGQPMPALELPCLADGAPVALDRLAGPAVVNLWASWCGPCRDELPVLQRYADRTAGRVQVVGVVTEDTRARARSFAADAGIGFPSLYDAEGRLLAGTGAVGLPATLFVDAGGRVRHLHNAPLDDQTLAALAAEHLGVVSP